MASLPYPATHVTQSPEEKRGLGSCRQLKAALGWGTVGVKERTIWPVSQIMAICLLILLIHAEMEQPKDSIFVVTY